MAVTTENATEQSTAHPRFAVGDVIIGRPWARGRQLARYRGVVVENRDTAVLVWFYGMGNVEPGSGLQLMLHNELKYVTDYMAVSVKVVEKWHRTLRRASSENRDLIALYGKVAQWRRFIKEIGA